MIEYNGHEVIIMTEKEALKALIDKLDDEKVTLLKKVAEAMIYPQEELTHEEEKRLKAALKELKEGKVIKGKDVDELFS